MALRISSRMDSCSIVPEDFHSPGRDRPPASPGHASRALDLQEPFVDEGKNSPVVSVNVL